MDIYFEYDKKIAPSPTACPPRISVKNQKITLYIMKHRKQEPYYVVLI